MTTLDRSIDSACVAHFATERRRLLATIDAVAGDILALPAGSAARKTKTAEFVALDARLDELTAILSA